MRLRIKELLKAKKMTAVNLAERVGITQPNMSNIVNGKTSPSLETLERISTALGVPFTELFEDSSSGSSLSFRCPHCGREYEIVLKEKEEDNVKGE